jgi:hypothetical protein
VAGRISFCPKCGAYLPDAVDRCPCGFAIPVVGAEKPDERPLDESAAALSPAPAPAFAAAISPPGTPSTSAPPYFPAESPLSPSSAPTPAKRTALATVVLLALALITAGGFYYRNIHSVATQPDRHLTAAIETSGMKAAPQSVNQTLSITNSGAGPGVGNQTALIESRFLVDTYLGTIGTKDFKLFIDRVSGEDVEGFDVAGTNRRPVKGRIVNKRTEPTGLGGNYTIFKMILNEPGDDKWDGEFNIDLWVSDIDRHGIGSWTSFNGKLNHEIKIRDRRTASDSTTSDAPPAGNLGDYHTGTFLDGFRDINARLLRPTDLEGLSEKDTGILRNFIYARHGRPFAKQMYRSYFSQFGWYRAELSYTDGRLNGIERQNVEILRRREQIIGTAE